MTAAAAPETVELARAIVPVARELLGEPTEANDREIRFGTRGSLSIDPNAGTWYDHEAGNGGGVIAFVVKHRRTDKAGAVAWLRERGHIPKAAPPKTKRQVAAYHYHDETGVLLFQVVRFEPKDFRQRARVDNGWAWNMTGIRRVLYRLPEVIAAVAAGRVVYIAEGEKGADAAFQLGVIATCSPGGANKWRAEFGQPLAGADVVILPDNDEPGRKHAAAVARALQGIAQTVRTLRLPNLPEKGDVADWVAAGGTSAELAKLTAAIGSNGADHAWERPVDEGWRADLTRDDREQPLPNLANAVLALRKAPELVGLVAYDEMLCHTMLRHTVPDSRMSRVSEVRPVLDTDVSAVQEWLQLRGLRTLGREVMHQAIDLVAREHSFHPVRDYLNTLKWDGVPRIHMWLSYHLGAEPSPYVAAVGRIFLIALVARIMSPGCKADYMLVLEGEQGAMKSTACSVLAGAWFSDNLPTLRHGDPVRLSMHLRGKWLIEIAEMSSISKAEAGELKAFLTRREERDTPKFGHHEVIEPRQNGFIGTTNKATYLRDETGGRRFLPVKTGTIDIDALIRDRDQLFAEAAAAYRRGDAWWPDRDFEREHIAPEQEARFEGDLWETPVGEFLSNRNRTTTIEVARESLFIETPKLGTADQRRITAILDHLGWTAKRDMAERWWEPRAPRQM